MISLRFTGGPLDGPTRAVKTLADEYRLVEGVYRAGRTPDASTPVAPLVVDYSWQPDDSERWHSPSVEEAVPMW